MTLATAAVTFLDFLRKIFYEWFSKKLMRPVYKVKFLQVRTRGFRHSFDPRRRFAPMMRRRYLLAGTARRRQEYS
jgi:hypothetical protein